LNHPRRHASLILYDGRLQRIQETSAKPPRAPEKTGFVHQITFRAIREKEVPAATRADFVFDPDRRSQPSE
jgi:hypothetical protein